MTQEEMQLFDRGYNEGVMYAIQLMAREALCIVATQLHLLEPDRAQMSARIKMQAKRLLQKRGLVPFEYDVMMGKAEDVELDFNIF